jgi:hypothetical protein
VYSLRLSPGNPAGNATLTVVVNADVVVNGAGDTVVSPTTSP